ncbi:MAG: hypothetical protein AB7F23_05995 [Phycisphaerae bacterium]|jgi:Tfp pilus assembly protein PilN
MKKLKKILGITLLPDAVAFCEVRLRGGRCEPAASGLVDVSPGAADAAEKLRTALKQARVSTQQAVVAMSSKYALTTGFTAPESLADEALSGMSKIRLEAALDIPADSIIADFVRCGSRVSVFAVKKAPVTEALGMLEAAGIKVAEVTIVPLVLGEGKSCEAFELGGGVEVAMGNGSTVVDCDFLADTSQAAAERFVLREKIAGRIPQDAAVAVKKELAAGEAIEISAARLAAQAALGGTGLNLLSEHKSNGNMRRKMLLKAVGWAVVVLLAAGALAYDSLTDLSDINAMTASYDSIAQASELTEATLKQIDKARPWFDTSPVHLDMLLALNSCFPRSGEIWLSSLASDNRMNQVISGRADSEQAINDCIDAIKRNRKFTDVKVSYIRKSGRAGQTVCDFAVKFTYKEISL